MTQMWLIPADSEEVDKIYSTMVQCQILNPDPNDSLSEDGEIFLYYATQSIALLQVNDLRSDPLQNIVVVSSCVFF